MVELALHVLLWSAVTLGAYAAARRLHDRWPRPWLMPVAVTPVLVAGVMLATHASYGEYLQGTRWLVAMLGPATVAFAVPIWQQRRLLREHWHVLALGMVAGSATAIASSWGLALLLGLDDTLVRSLLPRSVTTPFAMAISDRIGGLPGLTAVFVVLTGVFGALLGDLLLAWLPLRTALARGALFGLGAHGIGTARAQQYGAREGAVAGLMMVLVGVLNVLLAPLVAWLLA